MHKDASIQQLQKIRQLRVHYDKTMWPKWKQEPDTVKTEVKNAMQT